jgi:hypothetical protein
VPGINRRFHVLNEYIGKFWSKPNNYRQFLDDFAAKRGIDPLQPQNWYKFVARDLEKEKVTLHLPQSIIY